MKMRLVLLVLSSLLTIIGFSKRLKISYYFSIANVSLIHTYDEHEIVLMMNHQFSRHTKSLSLFIRNKMIIEGLSNSKETQIFFFVFLAMQLRPAL
jgi:hypothetical protein